MKKPIKDIKTVCRECGITANVLTCLQKYKAPPLQLAFSISTFHKGICDFCGEEQMITETRDFFHPDFKLIKIVANYLNQSSCDAIDELCVPGKRRIIS